MKWLLWFAVGFIAAASMACRVPTESLTRSCYHDSDCPKGWECQTQGGQLPGTCALVFCFGKMGNRDIALNQPEMAQRREDGLGRLG